MEENTNYAAVAQSENSVARIRDHHPEIFSETDNIQLDPELDDTLVWELSASEMSRAQDLKRKRQESTSTLSDADRVVLNIIKRKEDMAIWVRDIKIESKLPDNTVTKSLKSLLGASLIKEVPHIQFKGRKHYIAAEFEPSKEVTGGSWYVDGNLDKDFIDLLKDTSLKIIRKLRVATVEGVTDFFKKNKLTSVECTTQQISEILKSMVMDNKIIEAKSDGLGEYHGIPIGTVCYRCPPVGALGEGLATVIPPIPCVVCPRIAQCTPDGIISPSTCVYYKKWLNF